MRIDRAIKNAISTLLFYVTNVLIQFCLRIIFLYYLSIEYVGLNGLFESILMVLSLTELGIGPAIVFSLYKPLARKDNETIAGIMHIFKRVYTIIGIVIIILGVGISPWLEYFIKYTPSIPHLRWFYIFFVLDVGISYFYSYNRNLLIADQKQFIINGYKGYIQVIGGFFQGALIIFFQSYWSFLIIKICMTLVENIIVTKKTKEHYPFIGDYPFSLSVYDTIKQQIIRNVKALCIHKIGGIAVFGSANILLSKFVGLTAVGLFSNYYLIINSLIRISDQVFNSLKASVGNLNELGTEEKKLRVYKQLQFITAWLGYTFSLNLLVLLNPFIELWLGSSHVLSNTIIILMVLNFYFSYMRKSLRVFIDAMGLFVYNRFMPIGETILITSTGIILVQQYEITGVLLAMMLTTLLQPFVVEPYILFKKGLNWSLKKYYIRYATYTTLTLIAALMLNELYSYFLLEISILGFISKLIITNIFIQSLWLLIWWKHSDFIDIKRIIADKVKLKSKMVSTYE